MNAATENLWSASEAASATHGDTVGDWVASGVSIDTRTLNSGDLFIALRGPNHDGHDHVQDALKRELPRPLSSARIRMYQIIQTCFVLMIRNKHFGIWQCTRAPERRHRFAV